MRWSRLKKRLETNLCEDLVGRLRFHMTIYRATHPDEGRAWITLDGRVIFSACTLKAWRREHVIAVEALGLPEASASHGESMNLPDYDPTRVRVEASRRAEGLLTCYEFTGGARTFLDVPFAEALASADPVVRGLAVVDRRFGRRRLEAFDAPAAAPAAQLYAARRWRAER